MKRKLIALSTIIFAFFALTGITQGKAPKFRFKLTSGYGTVSVGDYHTYGEDSEKYFDDLASLIQSLGYNVTQEGEFKKINWGLEFGGEAILTLGTIGVGGGFEYLRRGKDSELSITVPPTQETYVGSIDPKFSVLSLYGNFYFFLPSTPPLNVYLYAGPDLHFGKITTTFEEYYNWVAGTYSWKDTQETEATATGIGFHAGVGLEYDIASNVAFFIEGKAKYCKIKGWEGEYTFTGTETGFSPYIESGEGTLYFYEVENLPGKWYSTVEMQETRPSGVGIRDVEEFSVNLTGFSLRAGIVIKF